MNANDPAFPWQNGGCPGMTLRTWLAGQALQGILGNKDWSAESTTNCAATAAREAAEYADALLRELTKEKP